MSRVSKDLPILELTLRRYEKPYKLKDRDLVKKLCLSIGMLQPGDSRDVITDVLYVLLKNRNRRKELTCSEIEQQVIQCRKKHKLALTGIASSNIRRQLKRLRDVFILEKVKNRYRIIEFADLNELFEEKIEKFLLHNTLQRVKEYFTLTDEQFKGAKKLG